MSLCLFLLVSEKGGPVILSGDTQGGVAAGIGVITQPCKSPEDYKRLGGSIQSAGS